MLSSKSWIALSNQLYEKFSSGAEVILFDMGVSYGSDLVESLASRSGTSHDKSKPDPHDFNQIAVKSGWGRVILGGDVEYGSHLLVTVEDCAFCARDAFISLKTILTLRGRILLIIWMCKSVQRSVLLY
jgi:hypothetical protein